MERPDRTKEIFIAALPVPPGERRAWLEQNCGGDAELLSHVQSLLEAHDKAGSFLADAGGDVRRAAAATVDGARERVGEMIGAYKLLESIGEGGFGTVWMAEQREPVRRLVALKVLKAGMDSAQVVARFEQERQALALMTHPNIAQVFDAGTTPRGLPFFVMELVKGVPVTDYCAREKLPIRARLDLFVQVCRAVQHAHGKGLIHRDIKPRNVLVATADGKPLAKVIDFGIAKATAARLTDKTLFTEHRAMVGTLEYMSPEQAQGLLDVDTRSDVYSLGALLYELLTGSTPFDAKQLVEAGYAEILRILRDVEPQRPSVRVSSRGAAGWVGGTAVASQRDSKQLFGVLRGELDWVVMKALEKDRGRRYASADGLAEDLERYLAGDPVRAVPPSIGYRVRKFVRRNRALVLGFGGVILATVLGLVGVTYFAFREEIASERQRLAEKTAEDSARAARHADYLRNIQLAIRNGEAGNREAALAAVSRAKSDVRGWEWQYARAIAEDSASMIARNCSSWASNATGNQIVCLIDEPVIGKFSPSNEPVTRRLISIWDRSSGQRRDFAVGSEGESWSGARPAFVDEDRKIAVAPGLGDVLPVNSHGKAVIGCFDLTEERWVYQQELPENTPVAASLVSNTLIYSDEGGTLTSADLVRGVALWRGHAESIGMRSCLISRDDKWVVVLSADGMIVLMMDRVSGIVVRLFRLPTTQEVLFRTPRDGQVVASPRDAGDPGAEVDVYFVDLSGGAVVSGRRTAESMIHAWVHGWTSGVAMLSQLDRHASYRKWLHVIDLPDRCSFIREGIPPRVSAVTEIYDVPVLCLGGSSDLAVQTPTDVIGSGGASGLSLRSLEWDRRPRYFADCVSAPMGVSGFRGVDVRGRLIAAPNRPGDTTLNLPLSEKPRTLGFALPSSGVDCILPIYHDCLAELTLHDNARIPMRDGPGEIDVAAVSGDGRTIATASATELQMRSPNGTWRTLPAGVAGPSTLRALALSPDGSRCVGVAADSDGGVTVLEWTNDVPHAIWPLSPMPEDGGAVVLAAAQRQAAVARRGHLAIIPLQGAAISTVEMTVPHHVYSLAWSPDGARLAVGTADGGIHVGALPDLFPFSRAHEGAVIAVAWSPDGTRLFSVGEDNHVRVWDPATGAEMLDLDDTTPGLPTVRTSDGKPTCLFVTPDGERLLCGYDDGSIRVWDSVPWSERVERRSAASRSAESSDKK